MKTQRIQQHKVDAVNQVKEMVQEAKDLFFANYRGLNVEQMTELRRRLREKETEFRVIKNISARIAISDLGLNYDEEFLVNPTALVLVKQDSGPVAKILCDYSKDTSLFIKGALIDGKAISAHQVETLSKLPGREQLYAMLMGTMNAPISNLMQALNGVVVKLVRTLQAVVDAKNN